MCETSWWRETRETACNREGVERGGEPVLEKKGRLPEGGLVKACVSWIKVGQIPEPSQAKIGDPVDGQSRGGSGRYNKSQSCDNVTALGMSAVGESWTSLVA
ncbi:hypothetical protein B0F90DRAFT_1920081 [Multifurca ochricompacta]|uniref:Uncharacterized protein n=1 Tax=Multifurca ochricompacta TaxID=376703 RepID=A0AAD4LYT5_9AGAM|nr:hypothetical protein B0F90DRAFT_1920081 [Multifurca ochricompacta]